jgi:hypothetical protein
MSPALKRFHGSRWALQPGEYGRDGQQPVSLSFVALYLL